MTTPEQRDPVEELRQRLQAAWNGLPSVTSDGYDDAVRDLAETLTFLNAACAKVTHPAVQAVARELVGMEEQADTAWPSCSQCGGSGYQPCAPGSPHPAASSHEDTEWCVFWGAEDPNDAGTMPYDTQEDAQRQLRYFTPPRGIARRNAIYGPWLVVDTEGGVESDPEYQAHASHRAPVQGCSYCPDEESAERGDQLAGGAR